MAINRVLNAIWAEISARGSLIKTATNPYNPSPGGDTPGANNQGLAALQASSPFIELDRDGHSAAFPVDTALGDEDKHSPDPLDENSGKYHVMRQYGDIYLFNDGNVIAWGGNGKNFSFGNGYEENHAWAGQSCVYNSEVFPIPPGAMSTPACFDRSTLPNPSPTDGVAEYEWLGGNVSKSWGVDYTYTYGSSYDWSGGPSTYVDAYGNAGLAQPDLKTGKHCAYSYGTGYEETLVAWDGSSGWFHADDSNSPYAGRQHDSWESPYLSGQTLSPSPAAPTSSSGSPLNVLAGAASQVQQLAALTGKFTSLNAWNAQNLLVSKSFGNTYDYHYGRGLSVQEGPSEERVYGNSSATVYGDSTEDVHGDSTETVHGDSTSTVTGDTTETITGDLTSMVTGNSVEQRWGGAAEFFMGGKSEMILAACDEVTLSVKVEIKTLGAVEVFAGASVAVYLGILVEAQAGAKFEYGELDVKTKASAVSVNAAAVAQVAGAATIAASPINLVTP